MSRSILLAIAVLTALAALGGAAADHNGQPGYHGDCTGHLIQIGLGDATALGTIYYVIVGDMPVDAWGYYESNGVAGLQRGGTSYGIWFPDNCQESDSPDLRWY